MPTKLRNYFAGFSFLSGFQYGKFRSKEGEKPRKLHLAFAGNDSSYTRTIALIYGRARQADPILLIAKNEGDFQTSLWVTCEGVLATNAADDSQATPNFAYSGTYGAFSSAHPEGFFIENIYVNGQSRHDPSTGMGIEIANGDQDRGEPASNFFPTDPTDFTNFHLGYWGSARFTLRINTKDHPSVDLVGGSINGSAEVQWGRVHRVYSDATTFVRRATDDGVNPGASPSFVLLDLLASKRVGAGIDYSRLNIQSFVDLATYCRQPVTNVFDGTMAKRWSFNGILDQNKSLADWLHEISLACYALPPYPDKDGQLKVRALKAESLTGVPIFSSKISDTRGRNIIWENGHSSLVKSRLDMTRVPNEIRATYIDKAHDPQYMATLTTDIDDHTNPISATVLWSPAAVAAGVRFAKDDKVIIDTEQLWITLEPTTPDGGTHQTLHLQRAYASTSAAHHGSSSLVQFVGYSYSKITIAIADREAQDAFGEVTGDQSLKVISKTIDLPGTTTADEAARLATLVLRAGEFGEGGLANNSIVTFRAGYRDTEDLEIGDIVEVEDDLLDPSDNEIYYRVLNINTIVVPGAGISFYKELRCVLHDNAIYDDTANTVADFTRINAPGAFDGAPPPVTNFAIVEGGIFDANKKPVTMITIDYTEPSPKENFRSLLIYSSRDADGTTATTPVGDWRYVTEVTTSGQSVQYPISGKYEWFAGVSRPMSGHTPDIDQLAIDGTYRYPRIAVLVDGVTDVLPAPAGAGIQATSVYVSLKWLPYTGTNAALFKHYRIYRNTVNNFSTATLIDTTDSTLWIDSTVIEGDSYYYWIVGLSILDQEGTPTAALHATAPTTGGGPVDVAAPDAPIIGTIFEMGSFNTNNYLWMILVDNPGSAANWNQISKTTLQVTPDPLFVTFPPGVSLQTYEKGPPPTNWSFSPAAPGIYHMRAKVTNAFGDSAWSTPIVRNTHFADNLSSDTSIPPQPDNLTLLTAASTPQLAGNEFNVTWQIPNTNTATYYGFSVYFNNSPTLPNATTFFNSFTAGVTATLSPNSNVVQVTGAPFSAGALVGKDMVLFATSRGATPTFDYEGQMFILKCTANTVNSFTLDIQAERMIWNLSGLGFYAVTPNAGNHFYEKITFTTPMEINQGVLALTQDRGSAKRSITFRSSIPQLWAWVALYNLFGQGKVTASPPTATFPGITSPEIGPRAITPVKLTRSSQAFNTNIVFSAADYHVVGWSTGTITMADGHTYSVAAGNTGAMSALTYIYLDPNVSITVLQVTTSPPATVGDDQVLLCTANPSSDTSQAAFFVPQVGTFGINSTVIGPNSISSPAIQAQAITAGKIAANTITASQLSATAIDGMVITGATLRTAASGPRVVIDNINGLQAFASSALTCQIPVAGGNAGVLFSNQVRSLSTILTLWGNASGSGAVVSINDSSNHIDFQVGATGIAEIGSTGLTIFSAYSLFCTAILGNSGGGITITNHSGGSGILNLDSSGNAALAVGSSQFAQLACGSNYIQVSSGIVTTTCNIEVPTGFYVGAVGGNAGFVFNNSSSIQGSIGGFQAFDFDLSSSTSQSNLAALFNGTLTRIKVFNDGAGHNVLYF